MASDGSYDPHQFRVVDHPLTDFEALTSLLKGAIGTGILAVPQAFRNCGWLMGAIGSVSIGLITVYGLQKLISCIYEVCKMEQVPLLTYTATMKHGLMKGPEWVHPLTKVFPFLVDFFLSLYYFGVCGVYVVFVSDNIKKLFDAHVVVWENRIYMLILFIPFLLLFMIRSLKALVPLSLTANILLFTGFGGVLVYVFQGLPSLSERVVIEEPSRYPLFFGTLLFAFQSIGLMIAIEAHMEKPGHFLGLFGVMNQNMLIIVVLYTVFGFFGYWRYGVEIKGSISLNLPKEDIIPQVITAMFAVAIYFSYPLNGYVTIDVIYIQYIMPLIKEEKHLLMEYVARIIFVILTVGVAILAPCLDLLLSLCGSLCIALLGLVFPGVLDLCIRYNTGYGPMKMHFIFNTLLILFGLFGAILGSTLAVKDLVDYYYKKH